MEHRNSTRLPVAFDVELEHKGKNVGRFKTRDLGLAGAFIETDLTNLSVNDYVTVSLLINREGFGDQTLKGLVVHHSEQGIGLMFVDHYPVNFYVLKALLYETA